MYKLWKGSLKERSKPNLLKINFQAFIKSERDKPDFRQLAAVGAHFAAYQSEEVFNTPDQVTELLDVFPNLCFLKLSIDPALPICKMLSQLATKLKDSFACLHLDVLNEMIRSEYGSPLTGPLVLPALKHLKIVTSKTTPIDTYFSHIPFNELQLQTVAPNVQDVYFFISLYFFIFLYWLSRM